MDWAFKEGLFWGYDKQLDTLHIEVPQKENIDTKDIDGYGHLIKKKIGFNKEICGLVLLDVKKIKSIKVTANKSNTRIISITFERIDTNIIQIDF